jgi:predicted transcriptional regulator
VQHTRRDATRVIYEILSLATYGASKTHIIYRVNLSFQLAERYIKFLLQKELLAKRESGGGTKYYLTTKGEHLLRSLRDVEKELCDLFKSPSLGTTVQGLV